MVPWWRIINILKPSRDKISVIFQPTFLIHFVMHKYLSLDSNVICIYSRACNQQWVCIGLDSIFSLNRRGAIVWTDADRCYWYKYVVRPQWVKCRGERVLLWTKPLTVLVLVIFKTICICGTKNQLQLTLRTAVAGNWCMVLTKDTYASPIS